MFRQNQKKRDDDSLRSSVIRVVLVVWVANIVAGMIPPLDYEPVESVNTIFLAIVGTLYVAGHTGSKKEGSTETEKEEGSKR